MPLSPETIENSTRKSNQPYALLREQLSEGGFGFVRAGLRHSGVVGEWRAGLGARTVLADWSGPPD
ncbi:MAG: hypothetical protein M0000_11965 [Actinomycetota bacterium]|nr:hypothetical protein [Actinomycetota bacterium]